MLVLIVSDRMLERISGNFESILILEESDTDMVADDTASDTAAGPVSEHIKRVSKYRSSEVIVGNILELCSEVPDEKMGRLTADAVRTARRIACYSPVHGCGQTSLAIAIASCLAEQGRRPLLLNLEACSGWSVPRDHSGMTEQSSSETADRFPGPEVITDGDDGPEVRDKWEGLSELMYYAACSEAKFPIYLRKLVRRYGEIDYVPPVRIPGQLRSIHAGEWQALFTMIDGSDMYDDLVLDLSDAVDGLEYILSSAQRIYTVTGTDQASLLKLREYEKGLGLANLHEVLYRTRKAAVPKDMLEHGSIQDFRDYARKLLEEEI